MYNDPFIFIKPDGSKIHCYGKIEIGSNFAITCKDEQFDGISADIDTQIYNTSNKICKYLYTNYNKDIEEIVTC